MNTSHEVKIILLDKKLPFLLVVSKALNDVAEQFLVHSVVDRQDCCLVLLALTHLSVPTALIDGHAGTDS